MFYSLWWRNNFLDDLIYTVKPPIPCLTGESKMARYWGGGGGVGHGIRGPVSGVLQYFNKTKSGEKNSGTVFGGRGGNIRLRGGGGVIRKYIYIFDSTENQIHMEQNLNQMKHSEFSQLFNIPKAVRLKHV